jgi:hypothetical protein
VVGEPNAPRKKAKASKPTDVPEDEPSTIPTLPVKTDDVAGAPGAGAEAGRQAAEDVLDTAATGTTGETPDVSSLGPKELPEHGHSGRRGIPVPLTGVRIPVPRLPMPSQQDVIVGAVHASNMVRETTPTAGPLLYYGGLGALAAFGVVDWPVAAAIGAGVWIARRRGPERRETEPRRPAATTSPPSGANAQVDRPAAAADVSEPVPDS